MVTSSPGYDFLNKSLAKAIIITSFDGGLVNPKVREYWSNISKLKFRRKRSISKGHKGNTISIIFTFVKTF